MIKEIGNSALEQAVRAYGEWNEGANDLSSSARAYSCISKHLDEAMSLDEHGDGNPEVLQIYEMYQDVQGELADIAMSIAGF